MNLVGTTWKRTRDGLTVEVVGDSDSVGGMWHRGVLIRRPDGTTFWGTPASLAKRYERQDAA